MRLREREISRWCGCRPAATSIEEIGSCERGRNAGRKWRGGWKGERENGATFMTAHAHCLTLCYNSPTPKAAAFGRGQ